MPNTPRAQVGDVIVIDEHRVGESRRTGEILEILDGAEHERYRVRWDDGHESILTPGGDAVIQHAAPRDPPAPRRRAASSRKDG